MKGICSTRTLLQQMMEKGHPDFRGNLAPVVYVPESLTGMELLENFRKNDTQMALVSTNTATFRGS